MHVYGLMSLLMCSLFSFASQIHEERLTPKGVTHFRFSSPRYSQGSNWRPDGHKKFPWRLIVLGERPVELVVSDGRLSAGCAT